MDSIRQPMETPTGQPKDSAARRAGLFLLLTAAATVVMVYARVSADADQPTLLESLRAIAASKAMYSLSGAARFISGVTLIAGAWFLLRTRVILGGFGIPIVPYLFVASGAFTAVSGVCALALAASAPDAPEGRCPQRRGLINRDRSLSPVAHRQDRFLCSRVGAGVCGASPVEGRRCDKAYCACVGVDWYRDAVHMGGRRDNHASNHGCRLLRVVDRHRRRAAYGQGRAALRRNARFILVRLPARPAKGECGCIHRDQRGLPPHERCREKRRRKLARRNAVTNSVPLSREMWRGD